MNRTIRVTATLLALLPILTVAPAAPAQPDSATVRESVVQIAVMDGDDLRRVGSGFAIADGYLLTAAHLVAGEDRIVAVPLTSRAELVARIVDENERADVALLSVHGLTTPPLKFAADGFEVGRLIYSAGAWDPDGNPLVVATAEEEVPAAIAEGSVGAHDDLPADDDTPAIPLLEHNAMIPAAGYGGPLLNECGEVAGLNRGSPGVPARRLRRGQAPEGVVHALRARAAAIATLLEPHGVEPVTSDTPCESALATAQAEAETAAAQLEQSQQELEEATGEAEETRGQLERTQAEREQAAARAAEAESRVGALESRYEEAVLAGDEQAEALRSELEAARDEREAASAAVGALESQLAALERRLRDEAAADRLRLIAIAAAAGLAVLVIVIVAVAVSRRRARQLAVAREEAERAQRAAADARAGALGREDAHPDCLLTGETGDGNSVSVKVAGRLLAGEGAAIGRSPRNSMFLIDDRTLSREHARLFADGDILYLEDLGSTNGTRVNGRPVERGAPRAVSHGDRLELGAVEVDLLVGK